MEKVSFLISANKVPYLKTWIGDRFIAKESNIEVDGVYLQEVFISKCDITPPVLHGIFAAGEDFGRGKILNQIKNLIK